MVDDEKVQHALDYIREQAYALAKARATAEYMEAFLKVVKANVQKQHLKESVSAQEREAYDSPEYRQQLVIWRDAMETYERLKWGMTAAQTVIDVWRTEQSNKRAEAKIL